MYVRTCFLVPAPLAGVCSAADLTGNWVLDQPNNTDGTVRKTYFDLNQDGARITGHIRVTQCHIRVTQFYYSVKESTAADHAVAVFNRAAAPATVTLNWASLKTPAQMRNLWTHRDERIEGPEQSVTVPAHGVVMRRVK